MKLTVALSLFATVVTAVSAAAAGPQRIRGTVVSETASTVTVQTLAGPTDVIMLSPKTGYVGATKASLADVQTGRFIGTATKDVGGQQIALEVVIFPDAMRGTGEGHYPWDVIPDHTLPTPGTASSSMTNGNVSATMPARTTASSMTNGNVAAAGAAGADKTLTVTYKGGMQTILVPPSAPVVLFGAADHDALQPGASVLVIALGTAPKLMALKVIVGKDGTKLPM